MFFLGAEGFSCSLDISKLQFLIKKRSKNFQLYFFLQFLVIKTLDPDSLEMLDQDSDPQLWEQRCKIRCFTSKKVRQKKLSTVLVSGHGTVPSKIPIPRYSLKQIDRNTGICKFLAETLLVGKKAVMLIWIRQDPRLFADLNAN